VLGCLGHGDIRDMSVIFSGSQMSLWSGDWKFGTAGTWVRFFRPMRIPVGCLEAWALEHLRLI